MATSTAEMDQLREQLDAAAKARLLAETKPEKGPSKAALLEAAEKGSDEALSKEAADAAAAAAATSKSSSDFDSAEVRIYGQRDPSQTGEVW